MADDNSEKMSSVGVEQLLREFLQVQHRRASVYNLLQEGFTAYLRTGAEAPYQELCSQVTGHFSECSRQVLQMEAALRDPGLDRPDLASLLQAVQLQEKQKLQMTATLQVLRKAGRPSERATASGRAHENRGSSRHNGGTVCSHGPESIVDNSDTGLEMAQLEAEYEAAMKEATRVVQDTVLAINEYIEEARYEIDELEQKREMAQPAASR